MFRGGNRQVLQRRNGCKRELILIGLIAEAVAVETNTESHATEFASVLSLLHNLNTDAMDCTHRH